MTEIINFEDVLAAIISGVAQHKNEKEIVWPIIRHGLSIDMTMEIINISTRKHIIRRYFNNGQKQVEINFENGLRNGKTYVWNPDGDLLGNIDWVSGKIIKEYYPHRI